MEVKEDKIAKVLYAATSGWYYKCVLPIKADLWNGFSVDLHSKDATLAHNMRWGHMEELAAHSLSHERFLDWQYLSKIRNKALAK